MTSLAGPFLEAATTAADLLDNPDVARLWDASSALAEFRVSGLAGHLASQVLNVPRVLAAPMPAEAQVVPIEQHYGQALWRGAGPEAEINIGIRTGGEELARSGPSALVAEVRGAVDAMHPTLAAESAQRAVFLPWAGWALTVDDFLTTRLMEIAVHCDDLAVSVDVATPALSERVLRPVFDLLFPLALHRHGPTAMLRALSRAERAPASIAAL